MRRMIDVHYDGSCASPEHPGLFQTKAGMTVVPIQGEPVNLPVGSVTKWCSACERWIECLVEGVELL